MQTILRKQFGALKTSELLIGDIGFLNNDEQQKSWIGVALNSEYWGYRCFYKSFFLKRSFIGSEKKRLKKSPSIPAAKRIAK